MYQIGKMPHSIDIGYIGETNFRQIDIDMTAWMEKVPDGVPSIVHIRPGESKADAYVADTTFDTETNVLTWVIKDSDIGNLEGEGVAQIWLEYYEDEEVTKRGKSVKVITKVTEAADDPSGEIPSAQETMLAEMTSLKNATVTAKGAAEDAQAAAEGSAEDAEAYAKGTRDGSAVESDDPAYHNNAKYYSEQAGDSATSAGNSATAAGTAKTGAETAEDNAEAWAKGTKNGTDVPDTDPAYHNNAKYYSEQAAAATASKANLTVVAPDFAQATANDAGSFVTYEGVVYLLPDGHTANTTWANTTKTATNIGAQVSRALNYIDGVDNSVDDILDHETYTEGGTSEYDPVTVFNTISGAYININAYNYAYISTPSTVDVKVYKIENGKTYKVKGRGKTDRPIYIAADNASTAGTIAEENQFDYAYGTGSSLAVEEKEYTSTRNGYLYITYSSDECGLWVKNDSQVTKYHIDDVICDVTDIKNDILSLNNAIFNKQIDSASALIKRVPRNAEPVAKVKSIANTVTVVRSITGRNLVNKDTVGDVDVSGTTKKGIKTIRVPSGRYYVILGNMGVNTKVDKVDGKTHTTLYQDQFPMRLNITDPSGGYFIVYAGSVSSLGDMSGLMIGKLRDDETTLAFEAYKEKTYTPDDLAEDNSIEVRPDGFIEFVNSGNNAVSSSIEYTVSGRDDDSTTRKEFIVSPDGSKFLPMVKDDGSIACARVVPKKALFIGNSLTSGWQTFGEAATEVDKDYIALFGDVVDNIESSYTFSRVWATGFEQKTSLANAQSWTTTNIDPLLSSDLDLIVVQLSENVVSNESAVATFPESSLWLLQHLRTECPKARVIWMGVWFDRGWVKTLLDNTANTGCEYVDIRPLYLPENVSVLGTVYEMESDYTKEYTVDSFTVDNGQITLVFTVDGVQYTATIPSYTSYTSSSDTSITVTGIYHVVSTYYASIHPGDEGFRKIANKLLFDLGISDSEETIPADT